MHALYHSSIFEHHSSRVFYLLFETGMALELSEIKPRPGAFRDPPAFASHFYVDIITVPSSFSFHVGSGDLNLGLHSNKASLLPD